MHRIHLLIATLVWTLAASSFAANRPNFLIIMADDCTHSDLPVYGGQNASTPHIDRLAREGLVFNKAYLSEAMCQPCRAELFSGKYPMSNGCAWNHSASFPTIQSMPHYLGKAGYRVGLAGKVHVKPKQAFPFEDVAGFDPNCVRNPTQAHDLSHVSNFIAEDHGSPFCLVIALVEPHVPWVMGDASAYPADQIKLPRNIADTERTRLDFGKYLAEITYMDQQVGEILGVLRNSGREDDTLVLFSSEQGSQFPGCKWTNWDTGVHTALIARWPNKVPRGQRTNALVQYADILPTLLEAADVATQTKLDGQSFLPVLLGAKDDHRQFVYGCHNNVPEGPPYPIRTISDGQFRYIRNLLPNEIYIEKHLMGTRGNGSLNNPYWSTWVFESWNDERTYNLVKRYTLRPAEQLYDTANDPFELQNLADDADYADIKQRLRRELTAWMNAQGDPGAAQDTHAAINAARAGNHLYGPHIPH